MPKKYRKEYHRAGAPILLSAVLYVPLSREERAMSG